MLDKSQAAVDSHVNGAQTKGTNGTAGGAPLLPEVALTDNARVVLEKRYLRRGPDGKPAETIAQMFWRVAHNVALAEAEWGGDNQVEQDFYDLLTSLRFFPNSPTFTGAGTPLGQLAACFVLKIEDDMGRSESGIFQTLRDAALIQQTGGGNGFGFSRLRPKAALVRSSAGEATGPVGFLRVYDKAFGEIAQGGCLLPETLVFTDRGLLRLDEIADRQRAGWQEHDLQVATDDGWRASPRAYNNGEAPILRVHTRSGVSLAGTREHRVKVMTEAGPEWRRLEELKPGDWMLVQLGQHRGRLQALRQPVLTHGNQVQAKPPSVLDEELAFFLGCLAGDGFVAAGERDHRVGVSVAHDSYLMIELPAMMKRLFNVAVHRQQKANDRSVTFVMDNRAVKEFLQLNGLAKARSRQASVPRLVRQSRPEVVGAYLRGLFEADGSLTHGFPSLSTSSPRLAEEVATLLVGLGCPVRLWSVRHGINHFGGNAMYHVRIQSSVGLRAWRERIGCDLRSRFVAAHAWQGDQRRESSYRIPAPRYWLQPVLDAITLEQVDARGRGLGHKFRSAQPRLRRSVLRYLRDDRAFTRSAYEMLAAAYSEFAAHARPLNELWFTQVTGVQAEAPALTLDLEVDGNHTYLAHGIVTHNTRRGANMAVLRCDHPDIEDFVTSKVDEDAITNFNISVGITDGFMRAVRDDDEWELRFPDVSSPDYGKFQGTLEQAEQAGLPIRVYKRLRARDLFEKIVAQAHHNGEPGVLFLDAANRENPVPHLYELEATNPCGEQFLGPFENCCLGSINLAQHLGPNGTVDWEKLRASTVLSTRFLDDVVSANAYVPAVPQLRQAAYDARRIGLGIMGLGDLMFHAGIRYGSDEGQEFAAQVMEFVRYHCMLTSVDLAEQRGPFRAIQGSIYDPQDLKWTPPSPLTPYRRDYGRPTIDWSQVVDGIRAHGIRNACQTTVAPTGTIATVAGCEAYGCEPAFALAYFRNVNDRGTNLRLTYTSPMFERALQAAGLDEATRASIVERVITAGTCQDIEEVPENVRHTFVVSADISAEEHVRMQAAIQRFVDNSLSKCVTGDTLVLTAEGLTPIADLSSHRLNDQFAGMAIDVVTPYGVEQTDAFYYGGMRETRRVRLSYGYQVEGTPNHRVQVVGADGALCFARLDELKLGETVVIYGGQQVFGSAAQPLPVYSGEQRTNSKKDIFTPANMSLELAYVLGCITSEGAITRNGVCITNGDRALLDNLGRLFERLFGLKSDIYQDGRRESVYTLQINSRMLRNWLVSELGLEAGARNKLIPTCILRASRKEVAAFLRGLFLDGYVTRDGRMFGIGLASKVLIRQLQVLLLNFGIVSSWRRTAERAWCLTVSGAALERLAAFVEFDEVWKAERLGARHEGRQRRLSNYIDLLPSAITTRLRQVQTESTHSVRSLYGEQTSAYQRARVNLLQGHRLDRQTAVTLYTHFNDVADPYLANFFAADHEGCLYVEVEAIETGFAEVFDLSVPGSHSFVANGLGNHNTCNFPAGATVDDVAQAYKLGWELGCKGLTVYVTGSRETVVLETHATAKAKDKTAAPAAAPAPVQQTMFHESKKPRPARLHGVTMQVDTPLGKSFITINENGGRQPFEVFITTAKPGAETAAVSDAIGRLISYILRLASPVAPRERLAEVVRQLAGIGGGRSIGFGPNRVASLPDGVGRVLADYLADEIVLAAPPAESPAPGQIPLRPAANPIGDLCPECGEAALVNEEGCRKCYSCGFSQC